MYSYELPRTTQYTSKRFESIIGKLQKNTNLQMFYTLHHLRLQHH